MRNRSTKRHALPLICLVVSAVSVAFFSSPTASGQRGGVVRRDVERHLREFDELSLDPRVLRDKVRQALSLTIATSRGDFEMELEPFDVRTEDYRAVAMGDGGVERELALTPSQTYRGKVRGREGSQVRLVVDGDGIEGLIVTREEMYFVEPARKYSPAAGEKDHVFYAESGVRDQDFGECGTTLAEEVGAAFSRVRAGARDAGDARASAKGGGIADEIFAPRPVARLATEADYEYFQAFGSAAAANNEIRNIVAMVDGIYRAQIGIEIRVVYQSVWETANDPYTRTNTGPAPNILTEFRDYWNANRTNIPRETAHMWTGKDIDGSTIGIAYRGVVCDAPSAAYGVSQKFDGAPAKFGLTAHEIGHNFGATHPDQENPPVSACAGSIMNSSINSSLDFCLFSRDQITNHTSAYASGSCLARDTGGCTYALSPASHQFGPAGGVGSVNVSTGAGCAWGVAEGASWLTVSSNETGTGGGTTTLTASPNGGGTRSAVVDIAGQKLTVTQAASPSCGVTPVGFGQSLGGSLAEGDCRSGQPDRPQAFVDRYSFAGIAGQRVRIEMTAADTNALDTYLYLIAPNGAVVAENDDIVLGQQTNSRIPVSGYFPLPQTGTYFIEATSYDGISHNTGSYTLALSDNSAASSVRFASASYSVSEGTGAAGAPNSAAVTVTRAGDLSGAAAVAYSTQPGAAGTECNAPSSGQASERCDFVTTLGTLYFAPGQAEAQFFVPVVDDAHVEGNETFAVTLGSPVGTRLDPTANPAAAVTILDNDSAPTTANPVDTFEFFVRQQYLDFLAREPDPGGFAYWMDRLRACASTPGCDMVQARISVSGGFYYSREFYRKGYFAYRFYRASLGRVPSYAEFMPDMSSLQGLNEAEEEVRRAEFTAGWVQRPEFRQRYDTLTDEQFVNLLAGTSGVALDRSALLGVAQAQGRAAAVRWVVEAQPVADRYFNEAVVTILYFGFLRRDYDESGFQYWLVRLNPADLGPVVGGFVYSREYQRRFGHENY